MMNELEVSKDVRAIILGYVKATLGPLALLAFYYYFLVNSSVEVMVVDIIVTLVYRCNFSLWNGIKTAFLRYDGHQTFPFSSCSSMMKL